MDSQKRIIDATRHIIQQDGYSDLSIRKIANEAEVDKSLIYHHYGSKKKLIAEFLDSLSEEIDHEHQDIISSDRENMLEKLLDSSFNMDKDGRWRLEKAFLEIQAQASKDEELSEKLEDLDHHLLDKTANIFERLDAENPYSTAEVYLSLVYGSISRKAALQDREGLDNLKTEIENIISHRLP